MTEPNPNPNPNPNPAPQPWFQGKLDGELLAHAQTRGWDKMPVEEAAINATKSHFEAQKFVGVPADRLIKLPTDAKDVESWRRDVWSRLGAGAKKEDYDFSGVKGLDTALATSLQETAFNIGAPKEHAVQFATAVQKQLAAIEASKTAENTAKLETERAELRKHWGANFDVHMNTAKQTAQVLGLSPETVATLEGVVGYTAVMKMFQDIGSKIGEDKFTRTPGNENGKGPLYTPEQAKARIAELEGDAEWSKRYLNGGAAENRELQSLLVIARGGK